MLVRRRPCLEQGTVTHQCDVLEDDRTKVPSAVKLGREGSVIHGLTAKSESVRDGVLAIFSNSAGPIGIIGLGVVEEQNIAFDSSKTATPSQTYYNQPCTLSRESLKTY